MYLHIFTGKTLQQISAPVDLYTFIYIPVHLYIFIYIYVFTHTHKQNTATDYGAYSSINIYLYTC